ncbi:MAG: patatin-like phospholipase family protein [Acidimicrobiales bacterium]
MGDGRGSRLPRRRPLTTALVLGAGGTVGLAYHAGALKALQQVAGFRPDDADLVIGTSAGSVVAAYIRAGWSTEDLWNLVLSGVQLPPGPVSDAEPEQGSGALPELFARAFDTPMDLIRRSLGSAFVMGRSVLRLPLPVLPGPLRRAFPAGLFRMSDGRLRLESDLPSEWPQKAIWLCAVDIVSGRRIVLGRSRPPRMTLAQAVMASCAIPGVYPPVRYGRRELIDGGAHSTTNLDLAAQAGSDLIISLVPMGYDPADPPGCAGRLVRRFPNSTLEAELGRADRQGSHVFLFRPGAAGARLHGLNLMRAGDLTPVALAAYEATARRLESGTLARMLRTVA